MFYKVLLGIVVVVIIALIAFVIWAFIPSKGQKIADQKARDLRDDKGLKTQARILSIGESYRQSQHGTISIYQLTLEVQLPEGKIFETSKNKVHLSGRYKISENNVHLIQEGAMIPIIYHPDDPEFFVIEFERNVELRHVLEPEK